MQGPKWRGASQQFGGRSLDGNLEMHARYIEKYRAYASQRLTAEASGVARQGLGDSGIARL